MKRALRRKGIVDVLIEQGPVFGEMFKGGLEKSKQLPALYEEVAKMGGAEYLNAGSVISTDGVDGLHLTPESHHKLGVAVAAKVKDILKQIRSLSLSGPVLRLEPRRA
jgi:hypothetical protein